MNLVALSKARRVLIEADLVPMQGDRFQPTGFADLGAATYQLPDGNQTRMLLVESAQSVANRLEATIVGPDHELDPALAGLSYIRVALKGASKASTNSLIEAHRLNSPFIISDSTFQATFKDAAGYEKGKALDWRKCARALFRFDVNSLLHGAFLANLDDGRLRVSRAVTGFIEARDVREVVSGGVKNNPIDPTGTIRAKNLAKNVYSNVPYQRVEYAAGRITAYFNLDLSLLRSYDLGAAGTGLLVALALLKVRRFLDGGLRLRTACDLRLSGLVRVTEPAGFELPAEAELLQHVQARIKEAGELFGSPAVTELVTEVTETSSDEE